MIRMPDWEGIYCEMQKELEEKACMVKWRKGEILQQLQVLDRIAKVLSLSFYGKGGHLKKFSFFGLSWNTPWN